MIDVFQEENSNGIRLTWNVLPGKKLDYARYVVPAGFHYTPLKQVDNLQILDYDPILCRKCKGVISPLHHVDFRSKAWTCPFCSERHLFPSNYAEFISEENLPAELMNEFTTIEYRLNRKETNWPVFIFVVDITIDEDELIELKESIQNTIQTLPPESEVGLITYGTNCNVIELGFPDFPKMHVFKGDKDYKPGDIQESLGMVTKNDPRGTAHKGRKFVLPLKQCEFTLNSFLDDLVPDLFEKQQGHRRASCSGLSLHVAVTLLESVAMREPSRICLFAGSACNVGQGKIVGLSLTETLRNYVDFEKGNTNTNYFKPAVAFYEGLASRASKAGQVIDIYSCALNQTGQLEMKCLVERTGGYMVLTDSFSTMLFKDSLKKIFDMDEENNLKMSFRGKMDIFVTNPVKVSGALGHLTSLNNKAGGMVSSTTVGVGNTVSWNLGGLDLNSTYTVVLDVDENSVTNHNDSKRCITQLLTTYVAGDRSTRLRVTTLLRKVSSDFNANRYEVAQSFDQEAAVVMLAKLCVEKGYKEESIEVLRWLDKNLIMLVKRFAEFLKDDPKSFKLSKEFSYFPQFIFYLRRSHFLQNFNASPDESTAYKTTMMHETVTNATIMIQPILLAYSPENPEANAVFLDLDNMKDDTVLLLDAFFFICIWHGEKVCEWRDAGYQDNPDYDYIQLMLDSPQEYAQSIIEERLPVPRYVSCDAGSGQERLIKCTVNISTTSSGGNGIVSDDVSLKVFMEHLIKKAVQS